MSDGQSHGLRYAQQAKDCVEERFGHLSKDQIIERAKMAQALVEMFRIQNRAIDEMLLEAQQEADDLTTLFLQRI